MWRRLRGNGGGDQRRQQYGGATEQRHTVLGRLRPVFVPHSHVTVRYKQNIVVVFPQKRQQLCFAYTYFCDVLIVQNERDVFGDRPVQRIDGKERTRVSGFLSVPCLPHLITESKQICGRATPNLLVFSKPNRAMRHNVSTCTHKVPNVDKSRNHTGVPFSHALLPLHIV